MKARKLSFIGLAVLLGMGTYMVSCSKKDHSTKADSEAAENNAFAEAQYNDVTTMVDQAGLNGNILMGAAGSGGTYDNNTLLSSCATLSMDTINSPHSITIDFGSSNCMCLDGRNRRGKIIATYTGRYRDEGTVIAINFDNYYVNDNKIAGTKTITNQGLNLAGNPVYKVDVTGEITKAANGGIVTWVSTRYREWKEGANTLNILDDVYSITGNASGTNANGKHYTITITEALIRKMNCRWFESGKLDLTPEGLPVITLDYGSSGCDANATITWLGHSYPIVLQ